MKVLHVCPYMHPAAGGPPVVVERYCQFAGEHGWEASAICSSLFCHDNGAELQQELSGHIDIQILPVDRPRLLGLASTAQEAIEAGVSAVDIVHVHTLWNSFNTEVRKACARFDRPYVVMPHGMLDPISLGMKFWRKLVYLRLVEKANLQAARSVIYTTPEEQRLAERALPWLNKGIVSPLGADDPPAISKQELRRAFVTNFPEADRRRCLLFLGRLHPKKGLDRILRVLPSLVEQRPQILLVVVGGGDQAYLGEIRRQIETLNLQNNVKLVGPLLNGLKWSAFAAAEVFLLPSRQENFAISVAEAMRMAVPVVVTDRVNSWPYVEEAGAGLVLEEENLEGSLCSAVTHLLENTNEALEMGIRGQRYAAEHFNWRVATERIITCYETVLATSA